MSDFRLFCVTNRKLCTGDFLTQFQKISAAGVDGIILREKDLAEPDYAILAKKCLAICQRDGTPLILNHFAHTANAMQLPVQLSFQQFLASSPTVRNGLTIGVSVHSLNEARLAEKNGATWLIAGHIYETACKPNLAPRGIRFLEEIRKNVQIPVFAIGGIQQNKLPEIIKFGANGCCVMSAWMKATNLDVEIRDWRCKT